MPGQDYPNGSSEPSDSPVTERQSQLSRRSVLRRAVGASAVGLAVVAGGGTAAAVVSSRSQRDSSRSQGDPATATGAGSTGPGPIVIYMADPTSGEMDIFAGTGKTHHRNQTMAAMVASMAPR